MNLFVIFYVLCCASPLSAFFDYDQAVSAAQNNNWESANRLLTELVVNKPDNPSVLYDAGIAAFNVKNFSQAHAYFEHAAQSEKAPIALKEQAYFNLGNTQVELKQLEQAIASYEKVLELNPNNDRAKHNLEIVKKMLEQQKQQQQEKQQEKDKKQKEKEQQKQDQQEETSDQDESGSDQGSDSQEQQEGKNEQQQGNQGQQKQEKNKNGGQSKENKGQQKQSQEQEDQQDKGQQEKDQQSAGDDKSPDKNKEKEETKATAGKEKQQGNQELKTTKNGGKSGDEKREAWLAQLLQENEQEDAQLNKQMMKAMVGNQLAGRDGQNCW